MMRTLRNAREVGRELGIHHRTVLRWWNRWCDGEGMSRRFGSGRPRKTNQAMDRQLVLSCKRNRFDSIPKLTVTWRFSTGAHCSVRTAYRRLAEAGIRSYRPLIGIPLTPRHKSIRKRWCQEHSIWTMDQWRAVMWTDESRFTLDFHDGRIRVHRLPGERFAACCVREHDRYGGGSVLVWGGIWFGGRSSLCIVDGTMTGRKYVNEIVIPHVIPTVQQHSLLFQHDNAPPHRASLVSQCLQQHGIPQIPWPARSPDLSPIEHAWDMLGRRIRQCYPHPPTNLQVLKQRLLEQWERIEQSQLNILCDSMPERLTACVAAQGRHTRF